MVLLLLLKTRTKIINTTSCILIESSFDGGTFSTKKWTTIKMTINNFFRYIQIIYSSKALDKLFNLIKSDQRQQQTTMTISIINPHRLRWLAITCSSTSSTRFKNNNKNINTNKATNPRRLTSTRLTSILIVNCLYCWLYRRNRWGWRITWSDRYRRR